MLGFPLINNVSFIKNFKNIPTLFNISFNIVFLTIFFISPKIIMIDYFFSYLAS